MAQGGKSFRRRRQLRDLITQAMIYTERSLLTKLPENHKDYLHEAAEELSIVSEVPYPAHPTPPWTLHRQPFLY